MNKPVVYGLSNSDSVSGVLYTGSIAKVQNVGDVLVLSISHLTYCNSFLSRSYTFHFAKRIGFTNIIDPNSKSITWESFTAQEAVSVLIPGKYVSIKFSPGSNVNSLSDMVNNEAGISKSI